MTFVEQLKEMISAGEMTKQEAITWLVTNSRSDLGPESTGGITFVKAQELMA